MQLNAAWTGPGIEPQAAAATQDGMDFEQPNPRIRFNVNVDESSYILLAADSTSSVHSHFLCVRT